MYLKLAYNDLCFGYFSEWVLAIHCFAKERLLTDFFIFTPNFGGKVHFVTTPTNLSHYLKIQFLLCGFLFFRTLPVIKILSLVIYT